MKCCFFHPKKLRDGNLENEALEGEIPFETHPSVFGGRVGTGVGLGAMKLVGKRLTYYETDLVPQFHQVEVIFQLSHVRP